MDVAQLTQLLQRREVPFPYKRHYLRPAAELLRSLAEQDYTEARAVEMLPAAPRRGGRRAEDGLAPARHAERNSKPPLLLSNPYRDGGYAMEFVTVPSAYGEVDVVGDHYTEEARMAARVRAPAALSLGRPPRGAPQPRGARAPRNASSQWLPSPAEYWADPANAATLARAAGEWAKKHWLLSINGEAMREAVYASVREATQFRPSLAKAVCRYFGARRVLDFSAGWGDRAIGVAAAGADYLGLDPNPALVPGHARLIQDVARWPGTRRILPVPAEEYDPTADPPPDLVFTSPPFFDFEVYSDDAKQSVRAHPAYADWRDRWLEPVLRKMYRALCPGGTFALHINDIPGQSLTSDARRALSKEGAVFRGAIGCRTGTKRPIPLLVWKKPKN